MRVWFLPVTMFLAASGVSCGNGGREQAEAANVARSIVISEQVGRSFTKRHWKFRLTVHDTWEWYRFAGRDGWVVEQSGSVDPTTRVAFQRCLDAWRFESLPPEIGRNADDIDVPSVEVWTGARQQRVDFLYAIRREFDEPLPGRDIGGTVHDAERFAGMWNELLELIEGVIGDGQELGRSQIDNWPAEK